jgi:hypothetical protein
MAALGVLLVWKTMYTAFVMFSGSGTPVVNIPQFVCVNDCVVSVVAVNTAECTL